MRKFSCLFHFFVILTVLRILSLTANANAQCDLSLAAPVTNGGVTVYTYTLGPACNSVAAVPAAVGPPAIAAAPAQTDVQSVTLQVNSAFLPVTAITGTFTQDISSGQGVTLTFPAPALPQYVFSIAAQTNLSSSATSSTYKITRGSTSTTGSINSPLLSVPDQIKGVQPVGADVSTIDVLVGVGAHVTFSNFPDYNVATDSVLVSTGVGHAIPEVLLGAGFTTGVYLIPTACSRTVQPVPPATGSTPPKCIWKKIGRHLLPDSIFVNTQIPVGAGTASGSISGFTFGGGYKIQKFVEILMGFSLAQYNEPSTGFRNAAAAVVTANSKLPTAQQVPIYLLYSPADIIADKPAALDGFPLLQQNLNGSPGGQIYSGNALLSHYRGGFFIGLAYPFSLTKLFQGK